MCVPSSAVKHQYLDAALAPGTLSVWSLESRGTSRSRHQAPSERLRDSRLVPGRVPYDCIRLPVVRTVVLGVHSSPLSLKWPRLRGTTATSLVYELLRDWASTAVYLRPLRESSWNG